VTALKISATFPTNSLYDHLLLSFLIFYFAVRFQLFFVTVRDFSGSGFKGA
jgi:hypothetical protein